MSNCACPTSIRARVAVPVRWQHIAQMAVETRFRVALPCDEFRVAVSSGELSIHGGLDETDLEFVLHAFDSALPYLASIGSEEQWGSIPFSSQPQRVKSFGEYISRSSCIHETESVAQAISVPPGDWKQMSLFEIRASGTPEWRRAAAMGISLDVPEYVTSGLLSADARDKADFVYLNYLIADRRAGSHARNTAHRLVHEHAVREAKRIGKSIIYVDCWNGNGDGLVK